MNRNRKGILLTESSDIATRVLRGVDGLITQGVVAGTTIDQEAFLVLRSRAGDWKEDPVLGPGLTKYIRGSNSESEIEMAIKQHFTRAGIDFEDYRERLQININS